MRPMMRLMVCRMGTGLTAPSRFLVRKSKKILGQKKPSMLADIWSGEAKSVCRSPCVSRGTVLTCCCGEDDQTCPVILDELSHAAMAIELEQSERSVRRYEDFSLT